MKHFNSETGFFESENSCVKICPDKTCIYFFINRIFIDGND